MSIPAVTGTSTGGRNGSGSFSVTPPPGAGGYLAVAGFLLSANIGSPLTPPAGWTLHSSGSNAAADAWSRWQIWIGGAGAGSSWGFVTSGDAVETVAMTVVGVDGPVEVVDTAYANQGNAVGPFSGSSPTVTTPDPALVVRALTGNPWMQDIVASGPHATTYPSTATLARSVAYVTAGTDPSVWDAAYAAVAAAEQPTPGASGTATWAVSGPAPAGFAAGIAHTLAITTPSDSNPASLDAVTPRARASLVGVQRYMGALEATGRRPTASIAGISRNPASLDATAPRPTASVSGVTRNPASLAGDVPAVLGALTGQSANPGTLDVSLPRPRFTASDTPSVTGSLTAILPGPAVADIHGTIRNPATMAAVLARPRLAVSGVQVLPAALAASTPTPRLVVAGVQHNPGTLDAVMPRLRAAISDIRRVTPPCRTWSIPAERRRLGIPAEGRTNHTGGPGACT